MDNKDLAFGRSRPSTSKGRITKPQAVPTLGTAADRGLIELIFNFGFSPLVLKGIGPALISCAISNLPRSWLVLDMQMVTNCEHRGSPKQ